MKTFNLEITNPSPILRDLQLKFSSNEPTEKVYLKMPLQEDYANPLNMGLKNNALGMREYILPEIIHAFGIRSLTLFGGYDITALNQLGNEIFWNEDLRPEDYLHNVQLTAMLKEIFAKCRTVAFDDWTDFKDAAKLWPELLSKVFLPTENPGIEFIFYLGDASKKDRFDVGQALEVMAGFSGAGSVTLALDEREAFNLWKQLNGVGPELNLSTQTVVELKLKYFSIYNTIGVSRLLIYSTSSAILISHEEQFILSRKVENAEVELGNNARVNFISGYSAGLLFGHSLPQSIALGLIVFGACGKYENLPDLDAVQSYISGWVSDLERYDSIYLYQ
ncbi:hypothetical protein [Pedobacter miscanthi]|uniref:Uncharacterized protein n=1 Tax=Pedobacter miscanthi TaxID=2259170 RepID=A0A366KYR9_9SPHI|nr:hypothetical protein [Pedobacter miscanthi]RBQ06785.1 hypothetical protein DRW42_13510 [Pedobacter miscanthi]